VTCSCRVPAAGRQLAIVHQQRRHAPRLHSNRDYTGENAGGDFEVFLYDTELQRFMQLSFGKGGDVITRSGDEVTYSVRQSLAVDRWFR